MKKIRCTLLCLTLLSAMFLTAGCRRGREDEKTSFPAESSSGINGAGTDTSGESTSGMQGTSGAGDMTGGAGDTSYEYENGAGSMSTDEGADLPGTGTDGAVGTDDGLMDDLGNDITDALDDIGDDMSGAMDDLTGGAADGTSGSAGRTGSRAR